MAISIDGISLGNLDNYITDTKLVESEKSDTFSDVLSAMMDSVNETYDLQNAAQEAEIQFALGESENTHDLLIAQAKASVALQYTVAVRDKVVEAYKEIMQMQV